MTLPTPVPGLVIRYSYLWRREYPLGQEEGGKDRPCAMLLSVVDDVGDRIVVVLPVTHSPPEDPAHGIEIPAATKRRLGLDHERSWIILTESNRFVWPGPDLRPVARGDPASVAYGELPRRLFETVRERWLALYRARAASVIRRTD